VEFQAGSTFISIAPLTASGVATTTTTFAPSGTVPGMLSLSAFLLNSGPFYNGSSGSYSEIVNPPEPPAGSEPISVTVSSSGTLTVSVEPGTVVLVGQQGLAQGSLQVVTVSDTRNSYPGWSVSGQASDFTGSGTAAGHTISGNQLGWHPEGVVPLADADLGPFIEPAAPGLGATAAILASAAPGHGVGTYLLRALLNLAIPPTAAAGRYDSTLTLTVATAGP
jgi:hypothetical protein